MRASTAVVIAIATVLCAAPLQASFPPMINEVDADQAGADTEEFVELYMGYMASLTGYVLVFFDGSTDTSYMAIDLDGFSTDASGFFVVGDTAVAGVDLGLAGFDLHDGPAAVALYFGDDTGFPNGTAVTVTNLMDALVYDTNDADDPGLLVLLNPGQPQVNEGGGPGGSAANSNQRYTDGGIPRNTDTYVQSPPTPDSGNTPVELLSFKVD